MLAGSDVVPTALSGSMAQRICPHCQRPFTPSPRHPAQQVCSATECQAWRKAAYHRRKLKEDPAYRLQCLDSQAKWRRENPGYMKRYRARPGQKSTAQPPGGWDLAALCELLTSVKNNSVGNILVRAASAVSSRAWAIDVGAEEDENNTPVTRQLIVLLVDVQRGR